MASTPPPDDRRVVLVTGASSGIGRDTAHAFARRGRARIVIAARREDALEETIRSAPAGTDVEWIAVTCDLTDLMHVERLVARVQELGRLDVLVNNAGAGTSMALEAPDAMRELDHLLQLNLRAPIALVSALFPLLAERAGAIVNVSSVAGLVGTPGSPVYSATKWGLTGFSEAIRARYAHIGIRVCCIQPGPVPTEGFPHTRLSARPLLGRLLASRSPKVADAIVRFADGGGRVSVVLPRTYAAIPLLRGLAPWLVRRLLVSGPARRATAASSGVPAEWPAA